MAKVEIPLTDESLNTNDPAGSLISLGMLAVGFAALAIAAGAGTSIRDRVMALLGIDLGDNPTLKLGA